ncbi:MAG: ABC transporter ATP-binding protein [Cyanobacteria bacterium J06632_22]
MSPTPAPPNSSPEPAPPLGPNPTLPSTLVAHQLTKVYGRGKRRFEAVRGVTLTLDAGDVLAFLGPNGAGKTTTIKMICGLIRPDSGQVRIVGLNPHQKPAALRQVGAVLEGNRNLYWRLTPLENLAYFGGLRQVPRRLIQQRSEQLLEQFGLTEKRKTAVQKLSRGMQQKLAIAVALIHQPKLLLLDEPTLGLDVEASETVKQLVRDIAASGCAILLTTHQLDVAEELSDRVAVIRQGQIIAEQSTQRLIQQFSGSAYRIIPGAPLDPTRREKLTQFGATLTGNDIVFSGEPSELYQILSILDPLPLQSVSQDQAALTDIFLKLVRQTDRTDNVSL